MTRTLRAIEEYRKGDALVEVRDDAGWPCAGVPDWVEQEAHAFPFACVPPDVSRLSESDRSYCLARMGELFIPFASPPASVRRFDAPDHPHLGLLRVQLDRFTADGVTADVHVGGQTVGPADGDERAAARRVAELYTLCFAHLAIRSVVWHGLWDGEPGVEPGLLRRDLSPKPAFRTLQKLIGTVWHSRADGVTDAGGRFHFRGFYGEYRMGVRVGDETRVAFFALRPGVAPTLAPIPAGF